MSDSQAYIKQLSATLCSVVDHVDHEIFLEVQRTTAHYCRKNIQIKRQGDILKSEGVQYGLQIILFLTKGRSGSLAITLDGTPDDIDFLVETVIQQCGVKSEKMTQIEPFDLPITGLQISDPRYSNLTDADHEDILHWNFDVVKSHANQIKSASFRLESSWIERFHLRSNGVCLSEQATLYRIVGELETFNLSQPRVKAELASRHFADVASRPLGYVLTQKLLPKDPGENPVIDRVVFSPQVTAELIAAMLPAFDIRLVESGDSFLSGLHGQAIAGKWVHIIDHGNMANGLQTRSFDSRGVPPLPLTLIKEGVFDCMYMDPKSANRDEVRPSGHAGLGGKLHVGNISIKTGRRSLNMILSEKQEGIMATYLFEPIQFDVKTGDFVLSALFSDLSSAKNPVGVKTIKSNILAFLPKVLEAANDQKRIGYVDASSWFLRDIAVENYS